MNGRRETGSVMLPSAPNILNLLRVTGRESEERAGLSARATHIKTPAHRMPSCPGGSEGPCSHPQVQVCTGHHHRGLTNAVTTGRCPGHPDPATGGPVEVGQGGEGAEKVMPAPQKCVPFVQMAEEETEPLVLHDTEK